MVSAIVHGIVLRGPTKPVCSMTEPCSEPARGAVLVFTRSGRTARVRVDASGRYRISLQPGTYAVRVTPPAGIGRMTLLICPIARPHERAGENRAEAHRLALL